MSKQAIVHVDFPAKDRKAAAKFFSDVFDWGPANHMDEMNYTTMFTGNGGIGIADLSDERPAHSTIGYVHVDDVDASLQRIGETGGKTIMPKTELQDGGAFALFADVSGNTMGLVQIGQSGDVSTPAGRPFVHVEIPAKDPAAQAQWYEQHFGWEFERHDMSGGRYTTFEAGNMGGGFPQEGEHNQIGKIIFYVSSDDLEADCEKIYQAGGQILTEVVPVPDYGEMVFWADPTGNRHAFWKAYNN